MFQHNLKHEQQADMLLSFGQSLQNHGFDIHLQVPAKQVILHREAWVYGQVLEGVGILFHVLAGAVF